jgi:sec-independent protein translocase protein TatC
LDAFFDERAWKAVEANLGEAKTTEEKEAREKQKEEFMARCIKMRDETSKALNQFEALKVEVNLKELSQALKSFESNEVDSSKATITLGIPPIDLQILLRIAGERVGKRNQLTTLSAQEMFVVYFKVTLMCGFIMACPYIFYQFWAFIASGLYPHEKKYVHTYLPFSVGLFLAGVFLCFIWVLPGSVRALLAFNDWLGVDPDIRLNEWLSLAIILPLVFGISFQTPLVMLFLSRLGMFSWEDYLRKWRIAMFVLACFAAIITPTPDAVTMLYLFVPMFGLYMLGIGLCKWMPGGFRKEDELENAEEVAV